MQKERNTNRNERVSPEPLGHTFMEPRNSVPPADRSTAESGNVLQAENLWSTSPDEPLSESPESSADRLSPTVAFVCLVLCCATFIGVVARAHNFWEFSGNFGDNSAYLTIAQATLEGRFTGAELDNVRQFYRGTGYFVALISKLTTIPAARCLPLLTMLCGVLALYCCGRLWGWRVATLFSFLNIAYTPRLCLGGCESIFIALLFASLWLWRKHHTLSAITCAALAVTTRSTGIFLLLALAIVLLWHRRWLEFLKSALMAAVLGALYLAPLILVAKDPWAPATGYADDWNSASPIAFPFYPLLREALTGGAPWTNHLKIGFYTALTIFGVVTLWKRRRQAFANMAGQAESLFFLLFAGFCVSYNSFGAYVDYPRYSSPLVPQSVVALKSRLLKRGGLMVMSAAAGLLSALSVLNARAVLHMLLP